MISKFNKILIILILVFVSISAVSAADNTNETININPEDTLSASYTVTSDNYDNYFSSNGNLIESSVNDGDTLTLNGSFTAKNFIITKKLNIVGDSATIYDGTFTLSNKASGSVLTNLKIINNGDNLKGIFLNGASNCLINGNTINNTGVSSYPICLNPSSNFNNITNNILETSGATYGHGTRSTSVIVLGGADNNYIANNNIRIADANAIYLSAYGNGGDFKGGASNNNIIYKNNITYTVPTTSWAYGIQLMGSNNTANSNIIKGAYRGISSSTAEGNKAINNILEITGYDFSTGQPTGGDCGIALSSQSFIKNNTISGLFSSSGITAGDGSTIENNTIIAENGYGVNAAGSNILVENNIITTNTGAGIYQQGNLAGIIVNNNTITSTSGVGVLLVKSSRSKFPSNITVTNNKITTSNQYMINAADASAESYTIANNTGTGKILTPSGEIDPSIPEYNFNGTIHNITPDNYHSYIDSEGNFESEIIKDGDILNFTGNFDNKEILVTRSVEITGNNPIFTNTTFIVTSDSVWFENITIINNNASKFNQWGIFITDTKNVKVLTSNITVYDSKAAYAIYIYQSSNIIIDSNNLYSNGDSLTYTLLTYGAENSEIRNNKINTIGTGEIHSYSDSTDINPNVTSGQCLGDILKEHCLDGTNVIPEIYRTYGILMIKSSDNIVDNNNITVTSKITQSNLPNSTNSLVGIDLYYDCDNNTISNNKINVTGKDNYLYGAGALARSTGQYSTTTAKNNTFKSNEITVQGDNVVEGLIFGQSCENTQILDNNIILNSKRIGYGINLESSDKSNIKNNNITTNAGIGYGIELYSSNANVIDNNQITGTGNIISAIAGINTNNNTISSNKINSKGNNNPPEYQIHDAVNATNSGIYLDGNSQQNNINSNEIITLKGYPVDLTSTVKNNTITDNYLNGEKGTGNNGVNNKENNIVKDNYANIINIKTFDNVISNYMGKATITITTDTNGNGAKVEFKINNQSIGNTTINNGKATLNYQLSNEYPVGTYQITAIVTKDYFKTETPTTNLIVHKTNTTVNVKNVTAKDGHTYPIQATVQNTEQIPIANAEVKFYRNNTFIGQATTDEKGIATLNAKIPTGLKGTFNITAIVSDSTNFHENRGEATLTISENAKLATQIIVENSTKYVNDGTKLTATLKDMDNNIITGQKIICYVNNVPYTRTTDQNGKISIDIKLPAGNYTIPLTFSGNDNYLSCEKNALVTIKPTIASNDVVKMFKNDTQFIVQLLQDNNPIANEKISFNINGAFYTRTTNSTGHAKLNINLPAGNYTITSERMSTGEKASNTVTVKSLIEDNYDLTKYFKNASRYAVKIIGKDAKVVGAGVDVKFNINGVFYTRKTNENGIASLNINLPEGEYIITAEYQDCVVSNKIKILPTLSASDLTKQYGVQSPFVAHVLDGQGNPLSNATVDFNINGVFYHRLSDANGNARLNINLPAGEYIITSSYNGANIANKVTVLNGG